MSNDYQHKNGSGSLFKNDKKKENDPDYKGDALIDNRPRYLSAWINTTKSGKKYMSIKIKDKLTSTVEEGGIQHAQAQAQESRKIEPQDVPAAFEHEDDVPF